INTLEYGVYIEMDDNLFIDKTITAIVDTQFIQKRDDIIYYVETTSKLWKYKIAIECNTKYIWYSYNQNNMQSSVNFVQNVFQNYMN
ncbi:hypothetical protein RFI_36782, partial [Reticulomyxa filosa]